MQFTPCCAFLALLLALSGTPSFAGRCTFISQRVQCGAKSCNATSGACVPCVADGDCFERSMHCVSGRCRLKTLKEGFSVFTIVTPLCGLIICAVAVVGGIGGGGTLVVAYYFLLDFPLLNAVALCQATIAGQSMLNVALLLPKHHPNAKPPFATRPLINYEYMALLLPVSLIGTLLGTLGSRVSPDWFRIVLMYLLLSYVLYRTLRFVLEQRRADVKEQQALLASPSQLSRINDDVNFSSEGELRPQYPKGWLLYFFVVFGVITASSAAKNLFASCNSGLYWGVISGQCAFGAVAFLAVYFYLKRCVARIEAGELERHVVPFLWSVKSALIFPMLSIIAGAAASMLGIGGGRGFLMLAAKFAPEEMSATGSVATCLIAVMATLDYLLQGDLPWDYGLLFFTTGACSTLVGRFVFVRQIEKHNWRFMFIGSLATLLITSMSSLTVLGIYSTYETAIHHGSLDFGQLCLTT